MKLRSILLAGAASLVFAGAAQAEHFHGWYIGVEGGVNLVNDWDFQSVAAAHEHDMTADFDSGWAVLATLGWAFHDNWRVELEGGYRENDLEIISSEGGEGSNIGDVGDLTEWSVMGNVIYDGKLTERLILSLGVGAGADRASIHANSLEDQNWNFAYQGLVGLNYAVSERASLFVNYRYLVVQEFDTKVGIFNGGGHHIEGDDLQKQTVTLGLRYDLQADEVAAPPPPPPPPPPAAVKQFIVFFGFNKCNITSEADAVLSEAAASAKSTGSASIVIVGHTDTVGSPKYNQKLSECRANAAKSNLEGKGVSGSSISASGRGETELMVQTGDGVKEPQNRRATIDLQ